jgi:hypothetical protein
MSSREMLCLSAPWKTSGACPHVRLNTSTHWRMSIGGRTMRVRLQKFETMSPMAEMVLPSPISSQMRPPCLAPAILSESSSCRTAQRTACSWCSSVSSPALSLQMRNFSAAASSCLSMAICCRGLVVLRMLARQTGHVVGPGRQASLQLPKHGEQRECLQGLSASVWSHCWRQTGQEAMMSDSRYRLRREGGGVPCSICWGLGLFVCGWCVVVLNLLGFGIVRAWSRIVRARSRIVRVWSCWICWGFVIVRAWSRIVRVWSRIVRVWSRIVRAWSRIVRVWSRIVRAWSRIVRAWSRIVRAPGQGMSDGSEIMTHFWREGKK